jgi:glycosyltransferase involved in cell wall biosynthesis
LILSICIPTYNNSEIIIENTNIIKKQLSQFEGSFEIIVGENFSNLENRKKILNISSLNTKIILHESNLGFGLNLFKTMIEAKGDYILLLGDDDLPQFGLLTELMKCLNKKKDSRLIILPLNIEFNTSNLKSKSILPWVFMRSGSMMGLVFNRQSCSFDKSDFEHTLYPQVNLSMRYVIENGFFNNNFDNVIISGGAATISEKFNDKMQRPLDYGVLERCEIIFKLYSESKINLKIAFICIRKLFSWAINIYFDLKKENRILSKKYLKALLLGFLKKKKFFFFIICLFFIVFLLEVFRICYKSIMPTIFSKK